ncbi:methylthioribulose 1-phosphate dehydratase [Sinimarinibacterium sp. NLF-5-8]|uniref:methylthioribulose 1-phosphate dehydratase n=1 Tax=Sinimarinibacterium sp. NLF-5-8 TaxID=2698684 RepID=UPI00137C00F2|nr:methylthioribulose 1-phosphate dehydratase [Sinimarinibacterium sp. NLF-5-8]QHS10424.1 methylthioribulose 1-phosphate dehydratase [Sinimarinibacterium sp. NLF-5-8]
MNDDDVQRAQQLIQAGQLFHQRGWVPATGGNFSARRDAQTQLITASGCHKGELTADDFLIADFNGQPLNGARKASYETLLHCQLYRWSDEVGAVLHTHSIANTVLSRRYEGIRLAGYELLKLLPGINTHDTAVSIPVFENDQNIARLAQTVDEHLRAFPETPAYLIAGHGLYAWGQTVAQARWRVEALEFMFECELSARMLKE